MENDEKVKNSSVQTYAEDMAQAINNDKSLVKKIIHAEEEHEVKKVNVSPELSKNKVFMYVSILLLFLALATLAFFFFKKNNNTVGVEKQFIPIIFNDQTAFLEVSGLKKEQVLQTVLNEASSTKVKVGGVEGIYLTENKQTIGLRRFLTMIKSHFIPDNNTPSINDNFLMGVEYNGSKNFFMLLKVRSVTDIFNSMRTWEDHLMTDLHGFIGVDITSDTNYLFTKNFEDGVIENKNARILYDQDGKIVIMYVFADDNSIVIAGSQSAMHEIVLRLASSKEKQ